MKSKTANKEVNLYRYSPLLVIIIPCLLYLSALRLGFVYFDDDILVLGNFEKISHLSNIGHAFRSDAFFASLSPYYRPLLNVSLMLDAVAGGNSPFIYHLGNIIYHILTCVSLMWLLGLLGFSKPKSIAAALIFAVHPMMGHAVLWIPARGDLLVTLFGLLSFALFILFLRTKRIHHLILHLICFAGAIFSKESAVIFPVLFVIFMVITWEKYSNATKLKLAGSWVVVMTLWYYIRYISIDHRNDNQVGLQSLLKNLAFIPEIVSRFFFPFDLPVTPVFSSGYTLAGIIIILLILVVIFIRRNRKGMLVTLLGASWFLGFCLPNLLVRLSSSNDSFEYLLHRSYLPTVGLMIIILSACPEKWFDFTKKPYNLIIGGVLILFSCFSVYQQKKYENALTFWGSSIEYRPDKAWFHYYMGRYYFKQKDYGKFEKYLLEAEKLKSYPEFKYQLGMICYLDRKDYEAAYNYFSIAFREGYGDPQGRANFVLLCIESSADLFQKGEYKKAISRCEEAVNNDPQNAVALFNLGIYLVNAGEKQRAASMWIRAIRIKPDLTKAYRSLCLYYRYDVKNEDSAAWYAQQYNNRGGKENLLNPEK